MNDNERDDRTRKGHDAPHVKPFGELLLVGIFLVSVALSALAALLNAQTINHAQGAIIGCVLLTSWTLVATQ